MEDYRLVRIECEGTGDEPPISLLVNCGLCQQQLFEPRSLPCQHTFCSRCLNGWCKASSKRAGGATSQSELICPVCSKSYNYMKLEDFQIDERVEMLCEFAKNSSHFLSNIPPGGTAPTQDDEQVIANSKPSYPFVPLTDEQLNAYLHVDVEASRKGKKLGLPAGVHTRYQLYCTGNPTNTDTKESSRAGAKNGDEGNFSKPIKGILKEGDQKKSSLTNNELKNKGGSQTSSHNDLETDEIQISKTSGLQSVMSDSESEYFSPSPAASGRSNAKQRGASLQLSGKGSGASNQSSQKPADQLSSKSLSNAFADSTATSSKGKQPILSQQGSAFSQSNSLARQNKQVSDSSKKYPTSLYNPAENVFAPVNPFLLTDSDDSEFPNRMIGKSVKSNNKRYGQVSKSSETPKATDQSATVLKPKALLNGVSKSKNSKQIPKGSVIQPQPASDFQSIFLKQLQVDESFSITKKNSGDKEVPFIHDIVVTRDNRLLVVDNSNSCVKCFDMDGFQLARSVNFLVTNPIRLCELHSGKIVVVEMFENHSRIVQLNGKLTTCEEMTEFSGIRSCMTVVRQMPGDREHIYAGDKKGSVHIITFGTQASKTTNRSFPTGLSRVFHMAVSSQGLIAVNDGMEEEETSGIVKLFKRNGKHVMDYRGTKRHPFSYHGDMTFHDDYLIVCDFWDHKLHIIYVPDQVTAMIYNLPQGLQFPSAICVTSQDKLVLSVKPQNSKEHQISIFEYLM